MKKIFVVDWLDKFGGAERVIVSFAKVFSFKKTYTLINIMQKEDLLKIFPDQNMVIEETFLKKVKKKFRLLFFTFHFFINKVKIDKDADLIISSSHAVAKGIKKSNSSQIHISYFQARNFNYIWDDLQLFFGIFRYVLFPFIAILRRIDVKQAQRPDYIICNSNFIKKWVKEKYNRTSDVIYPPVDLQNFPLEVHKEDYYVIVGRIVHVKRFDIVVKTFNKSGKKLIVIGDGDQLKNLKKMAHENIVFKGFLNSEQVSVCIQKAKGFIQMGIEGFGIAPIEAQSCGTPVVAFAYGGVLETVNDQSTGIYFYKQSVEALSEAIEKFEQIEFDPHLIRTNALKFSKERFEDEIQKYVEDKCKIHFAI